NGYSYCIEEASTGIEFQIIEKEFHTRGRFYAPEVIERMEKAVARHARDYPDAYPVTRRRLPFGSSNASMYLLAGYKAGWIVSVGKREQAATPKKKGTISKPANWHSMRDTWTAINKQTLRDSIGMAIEFCKLVDEEQGP
nr:hypothetical protein [Candidatus Sigynarchaeota archaeon]